MSFQGIDSFDSCAASDVIRDLYDTDADRARGDRVDATYWGRPCGRLPGQSRS